MSKIKKLDTQKKSVAEAKTPAVSTVLGRKRDQGLDTSIVEAAIDVLAEVGFNAMTMDMVAAKAKAGKASLYRRWNSKAELVRDSIIWMSQGSVELDKIPDTGILRDDLLALHKPYSTSFSEKKLKVLSGLGSFFTEHTELAKEATAGIFDRMIELHALLMKRAIDRKEIPAHADTELASEVIIAMITYYSRVLVKPFDKNNYARLLDHQIIPGLKNPAAKSRK